MANPTGTNAGQRHRWAAPSLRGGKSVTCYDCSCKKTKRRTVGSKAFEIVYQMPGAAETLQRPPCPKNLPQ